MLFQEESIFIDINQSVFDDMINEAAIWPDKETGGMMFGKISKNELNLNIEILRNYIPPDDNCIRKRSYFEIDPLYAKKVLDSEQLLYLGNWHKHLSYGGPSHGDHLQIAEFFENNPHLDTVVTFIIDFHSSIDYTPIIEVYIRPEANTEEISQGFLTFRVPNENISFSLKEDILPTRIKGIPKEKIDIIKSELIIISEGKLNLQDIDTFPGQTIDEKILSFPFQFKLKDEEEIELVVLISFPPEFPEGKIFIDIASKDMSKNITFDTHPAETLNDEELIGPFLTLLKAKLEDDVPLLLQKPLWKVMRDNLI